MKYMKNYLFILAVAALTAVACDKTKVPEYEAASIAAGSEQVFFPGSVKDVVKMAQGATSFEIPVQRGGAALEAVDVAISATGSGLDYYAVPGTVSFAAKAKEATLVITIKDVDALGVNNFYDLTLAIADKELATPYGRDKITISAGIELPWVKFDAGILTETWWGEEEEKTMEYQQVGENLRFCRITECFGHDTIEGGSEYDVQDYTWYWNTETDECYVPVQYMGYTNGNGSTWMSDPSTFCNAYFFHAYGGEPVKYGQPVEEEGTEAWFAFCDAYRAARPDFNYAYYDGNGKFYLANSYAAGNPWTDDYLGDYAFSGDYDIFAGNSFGDYTLEVAYTGMLVDTENNALPIVKFTSTKASSKYFTVAKYAITDQKTDPEATLAAIVDGTAEGIATIKLVDGIASVNPAIEPGLYRIVAVPFVEGDKNDKGESTEYKVLFATTIDFYFPGMNVAPKEVEGDVQVVDIDLVYDAEFLEENGLATYNSFAFGIIGNDIKAVTYYLNTKTIVDQYEAEMLLGYGNAMSASALEKVNSENGYIGYFKNLDADTEWGFIVKMENDFGESKIFTLYYKTAEMPYDGDVVVGNYTIAGNANSAVEECTITLVPSEEENVFYVSNLGIDDGTAFQAEYDADENTLTLPGILKGYENYGPMFGSGIFYYDPDQTMYYGWYVYDSPESEGDDELVFTVDPTTKQLTSILQDFEVAVFSNADGSYLGSHFAADANTPVALAVEAASAAKKSLRIAKDGRFNVRNCVEMPSGRMAFDSFERNQGWGSASVRVKKAAALQGKIMESVER